MYTKRDREEMEDPEVAAWPMCSVVVQSNVFSLNTKSLKLGSAVILPWIYWTIPFGSLCKHNPCSLFSSLVQGCLPQPQVPFMPHTTHPLLNHLFNKHTPTHHVTSCGGYTVTLPRNLLSSREHEGSSSCLLNRMEFEKIFQM